MISNSKLRLFIVKNNLKNKKMPAVLELVPPTFPEFYTAQQDSDWYCKINVVTVAGNVQTLQ